MLKVPIDDACDLCSCCGCVETLILELRLVTVFGLAWPALAFVYLVVWLEGGGQAVTLFV